MISGTGGTKGTNTNGGEHEARYGQRVMRWGRGLRASGRLLARRTLRRGGPALALGVVLLSGLLGQLAAAGLGMAPTAYAAGQSGQPEVPNTLAQFRAGGNAWGRSQVSKVAPMPALKPTRGPHDGVGKTPDQMGPAAGKPLAHPVSVALGGGLIATAGTISGKGAGTIFTASSEGTLELGIAPHSVDVSHAGGAAPYRLQLAQTQGGFRGLETQMAQLSLQVVDSAGHAVSSGNVRLLQPLTLRLHYAPHELDGLNLASLRLAWAATGNASKHVAAVTYAVAVDTATRTMTAQIASLYSGPLVLTANNSDGNIASSEHVTSSGNDGAASLAIPLDLPPAPQNMAPSLQLVYSSTSSNQRYSAASPSSWVGEGWNLSLGSITYDSSQNLFYLNDVGGYSEVLLCCMTDSAGNLLFVPHHHPQLRIFTSNNSKNPNTENSTASCFHVLTPDGTRYDLGCTNDSKRTMVSGSSLMAIEWDVNHAQTAGNANSYDVQYWQDTATSNGLTYTRDANPAQILYNYNAGTAHGRVLFDVHWPGASETYPGGAATAASYGTNYDCEGTPQYQTTLRCDDPITPSGWEPAPLTMATMTLDSVWMQVWDSGSSTYKTVREYTLGYNRDMPYTQAWDQIANNYVAAAGSHTLKALQEIPYQNGTAEPSLQPMSFGYTAYPLTDEYQDYTQLIVQNGNVPYDQKIGRYYLNAVVDEQTGASESVWYATAYGNSHGGPGGGLNTNPLACGNNNANNCNEPNDRQWPQQVVTQIRDNANGDTTTYSYTLNVPCPNNGCTEDTWIPPNGNNACGKDYGLPPSSPPNPNQPCLMGGFQNYYDEVATGFSTVTETAPDGTRTVTQYYAGNGWGSNDWDDGNRLLAQPVASYVYLSGASNPTTETDYQEYSNNTADCLVVASGTYDQLYNNPYLLCLVNLVKELTLDWEGQPSSANVPMEIQKWGYDEGSTPANDPAGGHYYNHFYDQLLSSGVQTNDSMFDSFSGSGTPYSGSPLLTTGYTYVLDDQANASANPGSYLVDTVGQTTLSDDTSYQWTCSQASYDGGSQTLDIGQHGVQSSNLTRGWQTRVDTYSSGVCGDTNNDLVTGTGYDMWGQVAATTDADALAGDTTHTGCAPTYQPYVSYPASGTGKVYTTCDDYAAGGGYNVYATKTWNALDQWTSAAWDVVQGVQTGATDLNGKTTSSSGPVYEYNGGTYLDTYTQTTRPLEKAAWTTRTYVYSFCTQAGGGDLPCIESDTVSQVDGGGTDLAVTRKMYDREGRLVETRSSGPDASTDIVTYTAYDDVNDKVFTSLACSVPSLTSSRNPTGDYYAPQLNSAGTATSAYVDPTNAASGNCYNIAGTTTYNDGTGRVVATDDAMGTGTGTGCVMGGAHHTTCTSYAAVVASAVPGLPSTDGAPYLQVVSIDGNLHQSAVYKDGFGRTAYAQELSGASQTPLGSGISSYAVTSFQYDPMGKLRVETDPAGHASSWSYDAAGRLTKTSDPDRGSMTYTYDANGNMVSATDARGAPNGTYYAGYDGLNRQTWRNTANSGTTPTPYVTYTYDQGSDGVGHLSSESFSNGSLNTLSGSYAYTYDDRGRVTSVTQKAESASYTLGYTFGDDDQAQTLTYPDGDSFGETYSATGWLQGAGETPKGGTETLLLSNISYGSGASGGTAAAGAAGRITEATLGTGAGGTNYTYQATYDSDLRPLSVSVTSGSGSTTDFATVRGYDRTGNVTSVQTTLQGGASDNQAFCYDEQNRLVWATSQTASGPNGCASNTAGSLTAQGALYTASYAYDTLDRLTSGPAGSSYTYGDAAHLHAATSTSGGYTAAYGTAGNLYCRAPSSSTTCASDPTSGQQLSYDVEHRLVGWQSAPSGGSATPSTDSYLSDGAGRRVEQDAVAQLTCPPEAPTQGSCGSVTTDTVYLAGDAEEIASNGSIVTSTTKNYSAGGLLLGTLIASGGTESLHVLASDGLGSVSVALDTSGNVTAQQLYGPYGGMRYTFGSMPTAKGYTGQQGDSLTGLDYYGARYYDPLVGQFLTPDSVDAGGLNRYAYVGGNPETRTDPTGHLHTCMTGCGGGGGSGGGKSPCVSNCGGPTGGSGCHSDATCSGCEGYTCGPPGCATHADLCLQIVDTFHDPNTRAALDFMVNSAMGRTMLGFLLAMGSNLGDAYIRWDAPAGADGYTTFGGLIQLNAGLFKKGDFATAAASLLHESVESYYAIEWGFRTQASQSMDYIADWFKGLFEQQTNTTNLRNRQRTSYSAVGGYYGSYGEDFNTYAKTHYTFEPRDETPVSISPGYVFTPGPLGLEMVPHPVGFYSVAELDSPSTLLQLFEPASDVVIA